MEMPKTLGQMIGELYEAREAGGFSTLRKRQKETVIWLQCKCCKQDCGQHESYYIHVNLYKDNKIQQRNFGYFCRACLITEVLPIIPDDLLRIMRNCSDDNLRNFFKLEEYCRTTTVGGELKAAIVGLSTDNPKRLRLLAALKQKMKQEAA